MYKIICFSHLRWNFVYQRPQHILSRLSEKHPVLYIEEPIFDSKDTKSYYDITSVQNSVRVVVPHLPAGLPETEIGAIQKQLLNSLIDNDDPDNLIFWYYSPLALLFSNHLHPALVVYDCMDELSAFMFAPPLLKKCEAELLKTADLVLTGGQSLYEAKKLLHSNAHCFPSSIDKAHFSMARQPQADPFDQQHIPHPRFGFFGVIDERFNIDLIQEIANRRTDWNFILLGPVVKIDPAKLPRKRNIHYFGMKQYKELPAYLSGWDVAIMPFALNAATRYISPTKTPEFLAGGKPVISTSIKDVIHTYGNKKMVKIADTPTEFIQAGEYLLEHLNNKPWLTQIDDFLADMSWDNTVQAIAGLVRQELREVKFSKN